VFDSHEGFTRAFSKQFGMNPHEFRQHWNEFVTNRAESRTTTLKQDSEGEATMKTVGGSPGVKSYCEELTEGN
jgi:hypothetical protein